MQNIIFIACFQKKLATRIGSLKEEICKIQLQEKLNRGQVTFILLL